MTEQKMKIYEDFWERRPLKRPVLNLTAPKDPQMKYDVPASPEQRWLDEEFIVNHIRKWWGNTARFAEGVPNIFTNLGPGCLAACVGGNYGLSDHTVWFDRDPIIKDWEDLPDIELNYQSEMWQHLLRLQNKFAAEGLPFSITDLGGIMDIVASLRGTEELLYDLYDYPEEVKELSHRITEMWLEAFDQQVETVGKHVPYYSSWMNIPSSKPWYPLQCDFSYMISPDHFEEFVLEDLATLAKHMPRSIYHLDGVGELPHLDMILDIPEITGIQWVAGDGEAPLWDEKWFPVYKKIQDKGKNLVLNKGAVSERDVAGAERLIKTLDPTGVYMFAQFTCEDKAKQMLENIERWSN